MELHYTQRVSLTFWLLALISVLVGGMVGLERTVVPLLGSETFGLRARGALSAFVISFGLSKAIFNLFVGALADRIGRRKVLLMGWVIGLFIPPLLIWAPSWSWIILANVLLGINQAFTWSMTVNMMVDLVPPERRGFAAGINEFAGYLGLSLLAFLTGVVASSYGLRPEPFYLGVGASILGLLLAFATPETAPPGRPSLPGWVRGVGVPSVLGCATNLKDGLVWLALPLILAPRGYTLAEIGFVAGVYPLLWASSQVVFGPLSDNLGRRGIIVGGMLLQGVGLLMLGWASSLESAIAAAVVLGLGTGMVYPTLIALVADRVADQDRATGLGIYRFFRDGGYAAGAAIAAVGFAGLSNLVLLVGALLLIAALWAYQNLRAA